MGRYSCRLHLLQYAPILPIVRAHCHRMPQSLTIVWHIVVLFILLCILRPCSGQTKVLMSRASIVLGRKAVQQRWTLCPLRPFASDFDTLTSPTFMTDRTLCWCMAKTEGWWNYLDHSSGTCR
jgi:hypothetical protein